MKLKKKSQVNKHLDSDKHEDVDSKSESGLTRVPSALYVEDKKESSKLNESSFKESAISEADESSGPKLSEPSIINHELVRDESSLKSKEEKDNSLINEASKTDGDSKDSKNDKTVHLETHNLHTHNIQSDDATHSSNSQPKHQENAASLLKQAEIIKIAQDKIAALESENDLLRAELERSASEAKGLREINENLIKQVSDLELKGKSTTEEFLGENQNLREQLNKKEKELIEVKLKLDEHDKRIESDFNKIRVRERELQNRLEIVKVEHQAVVKSKDLMILDLKRQNQSLNDELESIKKGQHNIQAKLDDEQERVKRAAKAVRVALSLLSGDENDILPIKKVD